MRGVFSAVMRRSGRIRWRLAVGALALAAAPVLGEQIRNHFDSDAMMREPGFFDFLVLGAPAKARWMILSDLNPPSAPNRLAQVESKRPADSIAAALRRNASFQDGSVSTFVKQGAGREGLIFRLKDEKNFLALLVDTSGEAVLSAYADGKEQVLGRAQTTLQRPWERYKLTAAGPALSVFLNDQKLFDARDPHPTAGRTGLAAAGPGEASFDEFVIELAESAPKN
jgi:hypothetical protein